MKLGKAMEGKACEEQLRQLGVEMQPESRLRVQLSSSQKCTDLWDNMGDNLRKTTMKGDKTAAQLLPSWSVFLEAFKAQEKFHAKGAFTAGYCPDDNEDNEGDPFDSGPVNSEKEPDLYPPDPNPNHTWLHLKQ
ncbi:hypothetical protein DUI87_13313 [Hirundo rustica rustica]|uniref:Uncharacterized protein n=1 Tax=Hirundo rustica rustica TaxID=333673 RepID=A0A3M0KBH3_HIRRU|nr:hypothetical protein DUI87_13313 [Hirundo rustica rustica]